MIYDKIDAYLKLFKNPAHVIDKRNRKLIDYDRIQHLMTKGEIPDKQLQLSAEQYLSLNAHLLDELPTFIALSSDYFDIIVYDFSQIQAKYWRQHGSEWKSLTIELPFGKSHTWSCLESDYTASMHRLEYRIDEIRTKPQRQEPQPELERKEPPIASTATMTSAPKGNCYDARHHFKPTHTP